MFAVYLLQKLLWESSKTSQGMGPITELEPIKEPIAVRKKRVQNNLRISNCSKSIDYLLIIPPSQFLQIRWYYNNKDLVPLFSPNCYF